MAEARAASCDHQGLSDSSSDNGQCHGNSGQCQSDRSQNPNYGTDVLGDSDQSADDRDQSPVDSGLENMTAPAFRSNSKGELSDLELGATSSAVVDKELGSGGMEEEGLVPLSSARGHSTPTGIDRLLQQNKQ